MSPYNMGGRLVRAGVVGSPGPYAQRLTHAGRDRPRTVPAGMFLIDI
jgi:hypothetical protein